MQPQYYIIIDGKQAGPFLKDDLRQHRLTADSLIWRQGLPEWIKASDLPEVADILVSATNFSYGINSDNSLWFAIINGNQTGPYPVETLISMGLTPETPVWRNGMQDWVDAATQPEIMRHFGAVPPHQNQAFGQNPPYGQRPDFSQNPQYTSYGQNNSGRQYGAYDSNYQQQYNQYKRPNQNNTPFEGYRNNNGVTGPVRTNWLSLAIAATVTGLLFSCIGCIFGIIGIINANKANNYYAQGFDEMGDQANSVARTMSIIAFVLAGIGLVSGLLVKYLGWSIY